jgi:uncharacterized protein
MSRVQPLKMVLEYDRLDVVEPELELLPFLHQVAFAAACCERLLPNYNLFSREADWGNALLLRSALDEVWQILQGKAIDIDFLGKMCNDCEENIPYDDDKLCSAYILEAQRASAAICCLLDICVEEDPEQIPWITMQVKETLNEYLEWHLEQSLGTSWEQLSEAKKVDAIDNHHLTLREIARQEEDLQKLQAATNLDPDLLKWLRNASYNDGKSLIDLS